jgi:predicted permease
MAWVIYRLATIHSATSGALILAAGFPNVTYLGLPVLQNTLGDWTRAVVIQYDLFACTPLIFTLGIYIARVHGAGAKSANHFTELFRTPPLLAATMGVILNLSNVTEPSWLHNLLNMAASSVVPLMLLSLGMSLEWSPGHWRNLPLLLPVIIIQLLLMPIWAWFIVDFFSFNSSLRIAVILEAAMPSMVFGVVLCDRFQLDTSIYAAAVTLSTVLSLVTLPFWYQWLS